MTRVGVALLAVVGVSPLLGCDEPVPESPGFEEHVRPIFQARCVRCHGAGGKLNEDPLIPEFGAPSASFLGEYDDELSGCPKEGEPPADASPTCHQGAVSVRGLIKFYVHETDASRMPPPPSPTLDERELAIVDAWADQDPPKR
jgi:mono/diheme cytochrome c family protein